MSKADMSGTKQVKVDNWGVFFLQRLKHFFNRTDYCDLTLQFQDYAQLKVHRLVLNACTEYFELLERTCEMYDDCLIMPDDLQADVVVPIVNFMYTGQLEYEYSLFERLYSTAQIMNMTVLTKLLDAQKVVPQPKTFKKNIVVMNDHLRDKKPYVRPSTSSDYSGNFQNPKKRIIPSRKYGPGPGLRPELPVRPVVSNRFGKQKGTESARPTRYEIPEELDSEDIFESSFSDISYESKPLMKPVKLKVEEDIPRNIYDEASSSRKFEELRRGISYKRPRTSSTEAPESKHIDLDQVNEFAYQQKLRTEYIEQDAGSDDDNTELFDPLNTEFDKDSSSQVSDKEDPNTLFSHVAATSSSQTLSVKSGNKDSSSSLNHAKIISEVLKKYPHLVKSNKNIKLKIMTGPNKCEVVTKNISKNFMFDNSKKYTGNTSRSSKHTEEDMKPDWTYVSKHMNSESMANLVSKGAENTTGPWLCLMCGTPGKALNFVSYNKYYRHLVDVHKEKISANICEYCGYKSGKRNHLLHHLYTKHNVPPPSTHSFPKCNQCSYVALTEAFLIKHKMSHTDNRDFSCNVCNSSFRTRTQLLNHIQISGHKISPDRKASNQCVYCNKIFLRETNLYTHLKLTHKEIARRDGIIDNSDEEEGYDDEIKYEQNVSNYEYPQEEHVNIKEEYGGKIQIIQSNNMKTMRNQNQKILNNKLNISDPNKKGYSPLKKAARTESTNMQTLEQSSEAESMGTVASGIAASLGLVDRIVVLNDNEYILQAEQDGNVSMEHTIGHVQVGLDGVTQEIILSNMPEDDFSSQQSTIDVTMPQQTRTSQIMTAKTLKAPQKSGQALRTIMSNQNQPIQIVVSGNQQYKAIVSSAPIMYSNSNEMKTTVSNVSQASNINIDDTPEGHVMVLQEGDYNMSVSEALPTDGSNIVVVYSHPVADNTKEYLQVEHNQFENITDPQEIETHMEQIHGETNDTSAVLSEQGLVHETVETWHEENVIETLQDDSKDDTVQVESEEFQQEIPTINEDNLQIQSENNSATEDIHDNSSTTENASNEIIISSHEDEKIDETCENEVTNQIEPICENVQTEVFPESVEQLEASPAEGVELQENGVILDTEQCMEVDNTETFDTQPVEEQPKENVEKLTLEWSDEDTTSKEVHESPEVVENEIIPPENTEELTPMEVEESIENIQEEVQKHIQSTAKVSESNTEPEPSVDSNNAEEESVDVQNNDHSEEQVDEIEDICLPSSEKDLQEDITKKEKTVEKISNLLNDWDDNDSQLEAMEVDGKTNSAEGGVQKDSNIDKLVSDWDDEEDK